MQEIADAEGGGTHPSSTAATIENDLEWWKARAAHMEKLYLEAEAQRSARGELEPDCGPLVLEARELVDTANACDGDGDKSDYRKAWAFVRKIANLKTLSAPTERGTSNPQDVELATYRRALEKIIDDENCDPVQVAHEAITPYTPWEPVSPETELRIDEAQRAEGRERLPEDVTNFIRHITLELQAHRSRTDKQKDALFQDAYRLYDKYQVDTNTCPAELHGVARIAEEGERRG